MTPEEEVDGGLVPIVSYFNPALIAAPRWVERIVIPSGSYQTLVNDFSPEDRGRIDYGIYGKAIQAALIEVITDQPLALEVLKSLKDPGWILRTPLHWRVLPLQNWSRDQDSVKFLQRIKEQETIDLEGYFRAIQLPIEEQEAAKRIHERVQLGQQFFLDYYKAHNGVRMILLGQN